MLKVINVVGARPNFMKVAPIVAAMRRRAREFHPVVVHTGQHYDAQMSDAFFRDLALPTPDIYLGVGSGSHAAQTAHVMLGFEPVVLQERPDWVVVVGDVNSTLACALVCAKLQVRVAHVEAGLRSRDRTMPEEINRLLTDQIADLGLPRPDHHLGVGSGSHAVQTARVMEAFEPVLRAHAPEWVVVVGDVNSTLACALVAAKLVPELGCRVAHVEAGLRSHDWRMPEEVNRVLTDRLSHLLLTPSRDAHANLAAEGIDPSRVVFVGNVMIDSLFAQLPGARALGVPGRMGLEPGGYAVVTLHRPSNVDDPAVLGAVFRGLARVAGDLPVMFPMHPRTRARADASGLHGVLGPVRATPPLGYREMLSLVEGAGVVLTDSGGLQEETTALGVPCVTLREQTERPVTVVEGTNRLAPWPLTPEGIYFTARRALAEGRRAPGAVEGWDGRAGERIAAALAHASNGVAAEAA